MKESQFTLGPWMFNGGSIEAPLVGSLEEGHEWLIADIVAHRFGSADRRPKDAEALANAHLIAAAPEMHEALKLLQAALTEYKLRDVKKYYSLCVADAAASKALYKAGVV